MYDYHLHSNFSPDGKNSISDICEAAINKGLKEICITDHVDKYRADVDDWDIDFEEYLSQIEKESDKYADGFKIASGIELGVQLSKVNEIENFISGKKVDFIIASVHYAQDTYIYSDEFHNGRAQKEVYEAYLNELLGIVKSFKNYNVVGHFDLISRSGFYEQEKLEYKDYSIILDEILKTIIESGRGIEINTSGFWCGLNNTMPDVDIIKRYRELGGEIITVGSDAHSKEYIGAGINETFEALKGIGFKYVSIFRDQKPQFIKLK